MTKLATVHDLAAYRTLRNDARRQILQAANKVRLQRTRYVNFSVRARATPLPKLLTMRNLDEAVAIVRHWGGVDEGTLAVAGFAGRRLKKPDQQRRAA